MYNNLILTKMKNKSEFMKRMAIADESFQAIESFYGKMKANQDQKTKFINSIKKEINKITRIKDIFKNPSCNYPTEEKDQIVRMRDKLDFEDKKLRNFLKHEKFSDEDGNEDGVYDEDQDDFLLNYNTKFKTILKTYKDELHSLNKLSKKKKDKQLGKINSVEVKIKLFEEHEYYIDQLIAKRDMIMSEKVESIQESMEEFLLYPNNDTLREELKEEYLQMLNDIHETIESQHIEEQKQIALENAIKADDPNSIQNKPSNSAPEPERPKTRKELREERIRQEKLKEAELEAKREVEMVEESIEEPEQNNEVEESQPDEQDNQEADDEMIGVKFEDMYVGKLIDVVDYMGKWVNAIVKCVDKTSEMITVLMDSGLELEITKADIDSPSEEVCSKFQSKTEKLSLDRVKKLKDRIDKNNASKDGTGDLVISRKMSKAKRQQNKSINVTHDETEKKEVIENKDKDKDIKQPDLSLEEIIKSTTDTPQSKEVVVKKKVKKSESQTKPENKQNVVNSSNFPELGSGNPPPGKSKFSFGSRGSIDKNFESTPSNKVNDSEAKENISFNDKEDKEPSLDKIRLEENEVRVDSINQPPVEDKKINMQPEPKKFKNGITVLDLLKRSYDTMVSDLEECKDNAINQDPNFSNIPKDLAEKYNIPKYPSLKVSKLVNKFSDSTLFFIFYYQQGTYSQMLAEEELIRRKWYYIPKYQTWFKGGDNGGNTAQKIPSGENYYFDFGPDWKAKKVKISYKQ